MVITPQNEIVLLNLPIEIDQKNVLSFANANAQFQWFRFQTDQRQYDNITYESYGLSGKRRFSHEVPTDGADTVIIQQGINDIIHPVGVEVNPFRPTVWQQVIPAGSFVR